MDRGHIRVALDSWYTKMDVFSIEHARRFFEKWLLFFLNRGPKSMAEPKVAPWADETVEYAVDKAEERRFSLDHTAHVHVLGGP